MVREQKTRQLTAYGFLKLPSARFKSAVFKIMGF